MLYICNSYNVIRQMLSQFKNIYSMNSRGVVKNLSLARIIRNCFSCDFAVHFWTHLLTFVLQKFWQVYEYCNITQIHFFSVQIGQIQFLFFKFFYCYFPKTIFFLLNSMVTKLHIHEYILFSHIIMLHHKWLHIVPSATQKDLIANPFQREIVHIY